MYIKSATQSDSQLANYPLFDCRRYIQPGDKLIFKSWFETYYVYQVQRNNSPITAHGTVTQVFKDFVRVQLEGPLQEDVNRWDISKVNGKSVPESCGYFGTFKPLPGKEVKLEYAKLVPKNEFKF